MSGKELWEVLRQLEQADLDERDRNLLRPAFAALHGAQAMRLPETICARIRHLAATRPKSPCNT